MSPSTLTQSSSCLPLLSFTLAFPQIRKLETSVPSVGFPVPFSLTSSYLTNGMDHNFTEIRILPILFTDVFPGTNPDTGLMFNKYLLNE